MTASIVVAFVVIMLIAMYIESKRRQRQPNRLAAVPAEPKPIPADIRRELDDKPEFWTERFHQLLAAVAAPSVVEDIYEVVAYSGDTVLAWESRGYRDCPCHTCRRICHA